MAGRFREYSTLFDTNSIPLGSEEDLPLGYQAGHSFGRSYRAFAVSEEALIADLRKMLEAYTALVDRGGTTPGDAMHEEAGTTDIEETRRYILSQRIERSPHVRREVLAAREAICECCGLDPKRDYSYDGPPEKTPLDVHHATPLMHLREGETRRYQIPDDFLVLCPTCHRMIHKQSNASDVEFLQRRIRFTLLREEGF